MNDIIYKKAKGFNLIEVIIAMTIIVIVAATFYKVAFITIRNTNISEKRTESLVIAQNYLEEIKGKRKIEEYRGITDKLIVQNGKEYFLTINIDDTNKNLVEISVNVKPKDSNEVKLGTKLYLGNE